MALQCDLKSGVAGPGVALVFVYLVLFRILWKFGLLCFHMNFKNFSPIPMKTITRMLMGTKLIF